jgi:hypothetical protein
VSKSIAVLQDRADRPVFLQGRMVRRPRQLCSEAVQALLTHLAEVGFVEAPLPGRVSKRWEHQSYLSGVAGDDACRLVGSNKAVAQVGALLRRYHDAVEGWQSEKKLTWFDGRTGTGGPGELVCHGDPGPWNLVWRRGKLVGLIDWEYATIGTRRTDIAYALHYLVPFRDRAYWQNVLGMARKPRRRHRMAVFAEAYGIAVDDQLVDDVLASQQAGVDLMRNLAEQGRPRQQQLVADGELDREHRAVLWGQGHRHKFQAKRAREGRRLRTDGDVHPGGLR